MMELISWMKWLQGMKNKYTIVITGEAKGDIDGIVSYIAMDNKSAARNFAIIIKKSLLYLSEFPKMGKKRPEYTDSEVLFFTIKWGYNIVYYIENDKLYIVRVLSEYQNYNLIFSNSLDW